MSTKRKAAYRPKRLRVGFVPLCDSAPLIVAKELGLFEKYGVSVELSRELGWASIRDRIVCNELDAAHALAGLPFSATFGMDCRASKCVAGIVLSLQGNAITLSRRLWDQGVRDAVSLKAAIDRDRGRKTYTFGTVSRVSSHHFLLRNWLASAGIDPDRDVAIAVLPPPLMHLSLRSGNLDGYCVGEPWNSMAVQQGVGRCVATSHSLAPGHPEKVLMVRNEFAIQRHEEHVSLIAALLEACAFCDTPGNLDYIAETLSRPEYVNAPVNVLKSSLSGGLEQDETSPVERPRFTVFHEDHCNEPTAEKAAWIFNNLKRLPGKHNLEQADRMAALNLFQSEDFEEAALAVTRSAVKLPPLTDPKAPQ